MCVGGGGGGEGVREMLLWVRLFFIFGVPRCRLFTIHVNNNPRHVILALLRYAQATLKYIPLELELLLSPMFTRIWGALHLDSETTALFSVIQGIAKPCLLNHR